MLFRTRVVTVAIAGVVLLGACSDGDAAESDGTVISIVPSGEIEIDLTEVTVPAGFPGDVPLPADIELAQADELVGTTTIYDITGWHPGTPVPLAEAYLAELRGAGFEITSRSDAVDSLLFVVVRDDWFVSAGFYEDPVRNTGTSIGVTVGPAASAPVSG